MAGFQDKLTALTTNAGSKNSRSPLNDPFYAESLIIQSKSIVGRMYSSNEYVRFKYECELNQLVKEYRVWLAEIKRQEREIGAKLDVMRREQREMTKERHDFDAIRLFTKTNREFINHYKMRAINKKTDRDGVFQIPETNDSFKFTPKKKRLLRVLPKCENSNELVKEKKMQDVLRLPQIVPKVDGVALGTQTPQTSLLAISAQRLGTGDTRQLTRAETCGNYPKRSRQSGYVKLSQDSPTKEEANTCRTVAQNNESRSETTLTNVLRNINTGLASNEANFAKTDNSGVPKHVKGVEIKSGKEEARALPSNGTRKPRIFSAPKSRTYDRGVLIMTARPSSACETT